MEIKHIDVSVIVPVYNGERWIDQCMESIIRQTVVAQGAVSLEVVVCNDSSTDQTVQILKRWSDVLADHNIIYSVVSHETNFPRGGAAKNTAVRESKGDFLCFQDVDDIMLPRRIEMQFDAACQRHDHLIGSKFRREPTGSTARFTAWANNLLPSQLELQIYTSHGPTVIMPTWFCHRNVYNRVGGFTEDVKGTPEDLIFFLKHLKLGGKVYRLDDELLIYSYHTDAATFSVLSDTIWDIRIKHLQDEVINEWSKFTIWNAGKQGRKFLRSLLPANQDKVAALCDVDANKIGKTYQLYCSETKKFVKTFPIIHFSDAAPPIVVCVKMDLTNGQFEANLQSMNLKEGSDYVVFS